MITAPLMPEYDSTPAGDTRRAIADGSFEISGDPHKMVLAIIESVRQEPAPLRLTLGKDSYVDVRASLVRRLEELDAQKEVALAAVLAPATS
jgi:hypothetical protein